MITILFPCNKNFLLFCFELFGDKYLSKIIFILVFGRSGFCKIVNKTYCLKSFFFFFFLPHKQSLCLCEYQIIKWVFFSCTTRKMFSLPQWMSKNRFSSWICKNVMSQCLLFFFKVCIELTQYLVHQSSYLQSPSPPSVDTWPPQMKNLQSGWSRNDNSWGGRNNHLLHRFLWYPSNCVALGTS